ncbi:hypothetical protein RI054_26g110240 [Pseudoscourfieldia marina]
MTHGATDKIPSIELFRSADDLSALRIIGSLIYVYDTSADIAFSPSNSPRVPTTPSRASTPHRFRTAAPVEGGGGDGLDEVDKFIHDALNQAPPTEGGASPIEGGGEPDLGALGIHGHSEQMVNDRVYKRITRITGDHTYEAYNHRLNNYDSIFANPPFPSVTELHRTSEIVRPYSTQTRHSDYPCDTGLESVTVDRGNTSSAFQQEKRYTVTQMASHAARRDGMSRFTDSADPHMTDLLLPSSAGTLV